MSLPGKFIDVGGVRLFVHRPAPHAGREPKGPPVVLVHGYLVSHWEWRLIATPLSEAGFDVIAIDLPGHGESDRPRNFPYGVAGFSDALVGALDALGIERATLVGHSMGGAICLLTAARHPTRVARLVVVNSACYPVKMPLASKVALAPIIGKALFKGVFGKRDIGRYFRTQVYRDPSLVTEEVVDYVYERLCRPGGQDAAHATMAALSDIREVQDSLGKIVAPAMVIWGEDDKLLAIADGRRLATEIRAELAVIPACGHAPNEERPKQLLEVLIPFLEAGADGDQRAAGSRLA